MANRIIDLGWRQFARSLAPLWIAHAVLVGASVGVRQVTILIDPRSAMHLLMGVPIVALLYVVILRVAVPGLLTTLGRGTARSLAHGVARA